MRPVPFFVSVPLPETAPLTVRLALDALVQFWLAFRTTFTPRVCAPAAAASKSMPPPSMVNALPEKVRAESASSLKRRPRIVRGESTLIAVAETAL